MTHLFRLCSRRWRLPFKLVDEAHVDLAFALILRPYLNNTETTEGDQNNVVSMVRGEQYHSQHKQELSQKPQLTKNI